MYWTAADAAFAQQLVQERIRGAEARRLAAPLARQRTPSPLLPPAGAVDGSKSDYEREPRYGR